MNTAYTLFPAQLLLTLVIALAAANLSNAQDKYGTTNGIIKIIGVWNGKELVATSNVLQVNLDYETAEIQIKLDYSTLRTGIDTLDRLLRRLGGDLLTYDGKLGIDYINTKKHSNQQFDISGNLSCAHSDNNFYGMGHLEHIEAELYSCVLTMSFEFSLNDTNLELELPGLEDQIRISIVQIVLKRDTD